MTTPLLLHIPHASTAIPEAYRRDFLADPAAELRLMTDWYTDELFDLPVPRVVFPVSRLVCDVERFRDDAQEEMARCGMGACYTNGHDGAPIRRLDAVRRETILRRWYDPHHARLTALTAAELSKVGRDAALALYMGETTRKGKPAFDTTHPAKSGAKRFAELFIADVKAQKLPVAQLFK